MLIQPTALPTMCVPGRGDRGVSPRRVGGVPSHGAPASCPDGRQCAWSHGPCPGTVTVVTMVTWLGFSTLLTTAVFNICCTSLQSTNVVVVVVVVVVCRWGWVWPLSCPMYRFIWPPLTRAAPSSFSASPYGSHMSSADSPSDLTTNIINAKQLFSLLKCLKCSHIYIGVREGNLFGAHGK